VRECHLSLVILSEAKNHYDKDDARIQAESRP
jgi:hypothetical protein